MTIDSLQTSFRTVRVLLDAGEAQEAYRTGAALLVRLIDAPMPVRDAALHYGRLLGCVAEGALSVADVNTPAVGECFGALGLREIALRAALTSVVLGT